MRSKQRTSVVQMAKKSNAQEFHQSGLDAVRRVLSLWHRDSCGPIRDLVKGFKPTVLLPKVEVALKKMKAARVLRFDPYIVSGYEPSENQISNALRVILDPNGVHGLGSAGLSALLDAVETQDESMVGKVDAIKDGLKKCVAVHVSREFAMESGRVDLRVDIHLSDNKKCLIFVENKKARDAVEVGPKPQTLRYEKVLREEEENGVIGVGIYLTPDEKPAKSKLFVSVSCERFAANLRKRLTVRQVLIGEEALPLILVYAFAITYAWMN
jgi:PD-(D/E)XK nuclease superfamily